MSYFLASFIPSGMLGLIIHVTFSPMLDVSCLFPSKVTSLSILGAPATTFLGYTWISYNHEFWFVGWAIGILTMKGSPFSKTPAFSFSVTK